jgi:hypothetical protein
MEIKSEIKTEMPSPSLALPTESPPVEPPDGAQSPESSVYLGPTFGEVHLTIYITILISDIRYSCS